MSSGPPDHAASKPSPEEEEEGNARRRRIAYSREFLISVGTSSEACRRLPVGLDASKLSELGLVETVSRGRYVAPFGRLGDACSSGSGNTESKSNQLDMHPGNQCRHNWQSKEHDGLLGSGGFPRSYARPLASNGQGSGYQRTRNPGGYQPTRQYEALPVSQKNVGLINTVKFGSSENWNKDNVEEERNRRAAFELIRKKQHQALQEKKAPDSDKENLGDGIISLLQDSAAKRDPPTKSDKQGGLNVSSLSKEDAIETAPILPTPTTSPLKPLGFTNRLPQKRLQTQSFNASRNLEIQQLNTEDMMVANVPESSISAQCFSGGGILGPGHAETLSPKQMAPFSRSKCGPFNMRPGTVVECDNPAFSGSSQEGANFEEEGLAIHLPDEDTLFSVNDFLYTQDNDHWSSAECARAEVLPPKDNFADLSYRFQSLDVSGSHFHDQIDPNNLYHLFESRPKAEFPKRNAGTMFLPSRPSDRNQQTSFDMPKPIHNDAYCPFPQDMKSVQQVFPAPGVPCADLAAPQHILQYMTMPGNFPPQGFPRCAGLPQPVQPMPDYRTEMTGAQGFQIYYCPGYGETRMTMAGPPGPDMEVNQAAAFDMLFQMELRARSRQMHPELAGPADSHYGHYRR